MRPLATNQRMLALVSGHPSEDGTTKPERIIQIIVGILVSTICVGAIVECLIYFFKFISTDLGESLYFLYVFSAIYPTLNGIIVACILWSKIFGLMEKLSEIYKASRCLKFLDNTKFQ